MEEREIKIKVCGKRISFETFGSVWTIQEVVQVIFELLNGIIQSSEMRIEKK